MNPVSGARRSNRRKPAPEPSAPLESDHPSVDHPSARARSRLLLVRPNRLHRPRSVGSVIESARRLTKGDRIPEGARPGQDLPSARAIATLPSGSGSSFDRFRPREPQRRQPLRSALDGRRSRSREPPARPLSVSVAHGGDERMIDRLRPGSPLFWHQSRIYLCYFAKSFYVIRAYPTPQHPLRRDPMPVTAAPKNLPTTFYGTILRLLATSVLYLLWLLTSPALLEARVIELPDRVEEGHPSADGKWFVYLGNEERTIDWTAGDIWAIPLDGSERAKFLGRARAQRRLFRVAPTSVGVAFLNQTSAGRLQVFFAAYQGGAPVQVTDLPQGRALPRSPIR